MMLPAGGKIYLDTNVWIYLAEAFPQQEAALWSLAQSWAEGTIQVVASVLAWGECLIVPLRENDAARKEQYDRLFGETGHMEVLSVTREIMLLAAKWRAAMGLSFADAIHLATASTSGCSTFVTNDQQLLKPAIRQSVTPLIVQSLEMVGQ